MKVQFEPLFTDKSDSISSFSSDVLNIIAEYMEEASRSYAKRGITELSKDAHTRAEAIKNKLIAYHYYDSKDSILSRMSETNIKNRGTDGKYVSRETMKEGGLYN